jgi:hypothetical protein
MAGLQLASGGPDWIADTEVGAPILHCRKTGILSIYFALMARGLGVIGQSVTNGLLQIFWEVW